MLIKHLKNITFRVKSDQIRSQYHSFSSFLSFSWASFTDQETDSFNLES